MTLDAETRQHLLELAYDLLPETEAAQWRERIEREPELAKAYVEAKATANLFAQAARVQSPRISLKTPTEAEKPPVAKKKPSVGVAEPKSGAKSGSPIGSPWARGANWAVGLVAGVLLAVSLWEYLYHRDQLQAIGAEQMRLVVTGPASLRSGVETQYHVATHSATGEPFPAAVEFSMVPSDGSEPFVENRMTDEQGELTISVPGNFSVGATARLEISANYEKIEERVETLLAVEPVRYTTRLTLDKPVYRPGETVYYRSLTLSRFSLQADRPREIEFQVLDPDGQTVPSGRLEGTTEDGVGNGSFTIPAGDGTPTGQYTLLVHSPDGAFVEQRQPFLVLKDRPPALDMQLAFDSDRYAPGDKVTAGFIVRKNSGEPAAKARLLAAATVAGEEVYRSEIETDETGAARIEFALPQDLTRGYARLDLAVDEGDVQGSLSKRIPVSVDHVDIDFFPEGGDLVGGLDNRVYFAAYDALGQSVEVAGTVLDANERPIVAVKTTHQGRGTFRFTPKVGQQYRLRVRQPDGISKPVYLPWVSAKRHVLLTTGSGVFPAKQPLEFHIRAARPGIPLVVSAWCRGVPVGQRLLVTRHQPQNDTSADPNSPTGNPVVIALPDQVGGVIRLTVHDYSVGPPEPVAERLVYRRPAKRLTVEAGGVEDPLAPGSEVSMSLSVQDESGKPVRAVLGVSVVDSRVLDLLGGPRHNIATHFLLGTEIKSPEDLEDANFYLDENADSAVALDLLLGTQGWRRFVGKTLDELRADMDPEQLARFVAVGGTAEPPAVFDNLAGIQSKLDQRLAEYRQDRTPTLSTITTVSFFVGLGLVLLVAMLGTLRVVAGMHLWVPAVGVTGCCLTIGMILMEPERFEFGENATVAFNSFHAPVPSDLDDGEGVDDAAKRDQANIDKLEKSEAGKDVDARKDAYRMVERESFDVRLPGEKGPEKFKKESADTLNRLDEFFGQRQRKLLAESLSEENSRRRLGEIGRENVPLDEAIEDAEVDDPATMEEAGGIEREKTLAVRTYRYVAKTTGPSAGDFVDTLYWHPKLTVQPGKPASVSFHLGDNPGTYRLRIDAHGQQRIGFGTAEIISQRPASPDSEETSEASPGDDPISSTSSTEDLADHGDDCPVRLATRLGESSVTVGQTVPLNIELTNTTSREQPTALAVIGLPEGLHLDADQLVKIKGSAGLYSWEIRSRELTLSWHSLAKEETVSLSLELIAETPGKHTGIASHCYLADHPEQRFETDPLQIEITRSDATGD